MNRIKNHPYTTLGLLLAIGAIASGVVYYNIPNIRRPLEVLLALIAVVCFAIVVLVSINSVRLAALVATSLFGSMFLLEYSAKYFDITELFESGTARGIASDKGEIGWTDYQSYLAGREKARAAGWDPAAFENDFAGDIFAGVDPKTLVVDKSENADRIMVDISLKPFRKFGPPLGFELNPDNVVRHYFIEKKGGQTLFDGKITSDSAGCRIARDNPDSDEAYLFYGCSVTFGYGLSDEQTMPHFFSEAGGFSRRIANMAFNGCGPNHSLRDLELNYHFDRTGIAQQNVKGVFFGLIDDHPLRMMRPVRSQSPYYSLDANGEPVHRGTFMDNVGESAFGRFYVMMGKSRIWPKLREKFMLKSIEEDRADQWLLAHAILKAMDRLCRERYGVGLTVVYWGKNPGVIKTIRNNGLDLVTIAEALGNEWEQKSILYLLHDGHPNAYANRKLGYFLYDRLLREKGGNATS